jgi:hypothetical protein
MKVNGYLLIGVFFILGLFLPLVEQMTGLFPVKELSGVEKETVMPEITFSGWLDKSVQQQFETWFTGHVGLRPWMVRTANQMNFSLFGEIPAGSGTRVYQGRDNVLYEKAYVTAYNTPGKKREKLLHDITWGLWRLQELLEQHGVAFLLVLAPSKAEIYPEYLPGDLKKPGRDKRLSHYQRMVPMLEKFGIHYIDSHKLFLQWKENGSPLLFARGGTHWNYYGAGRIVQAIMDGIAAQRGQSYDTIKVVSYTTDSRGFGTDKDLSELLNLWSTNKFNRGQIHPVFKRIPGKQRSNILMVGDSFAFTLINVMEAQKLFKRCDLFYYFKRRFSWPAGTNDPIDHVKIDLRRELLGRDAVIIEINEYWLPQYGFGLLRPAIAALETTHVDK